MIHTISNYIKKSWSIKEKFRAFMGLSSIILVIMLLAGIYKHYIFHIHSIQVENNSKKLLLNLTANFNNTALMAEIQSDFTAFTQTAHPETMKALIKKSKRLMEHLPKAAHPDLIHFLNQAGKLEIRMTSLRNNNKTALETGNKILGQLQDLEKCHQNKTCLNAIHQASMTYRTFHPLYITNILNGQITTFDRTTTEISLDFDEVINTLFEATKTLPVEQSTYLTQLRDMFMNLDDATATVAAIKGKVLSTAQDAINTLNHINTTLNKQSITQQKSALNLSKQGLSIAQNAGILMIFTLISFTALFLTVSFFISKSIVNPLNTLVQLLENFSRLLTNIRTQNVNDNDRHALLHSAIADRHDEIGDVAQATMGLMQHMRSISEFRKKIEDDLATKDVYFRLARIFRKLLKFRSFIIYEIDKNEAMNPVFVYPQAIEKYLPNLTISTLCRAKRTGAVVSSITDPTICRICPFNDVLNHICIPMLAGGQVMGVVQLITPISLNRRSTDILNKTLDVAKNYIEEALPVIQAKRFARELEEMATKDQLTGLYNRRYLEISLQQIIAGVKRRGTQLGILMCDMDFFKQVNDTHGHDAGDIILTKLSAILLENVRESDLVIRFGGEEFLILLLDIQENQTSKVAEKIRAAVEDYTFQLQRADIKKTLSIGTAEFPGTGGNGIWEIIKQADVALYKAKNTGRNKVVEFSKELWNEQSY